MTKRYFTLESAQRNLPKIKKFLLKIQNLKKAIDTITSISIDPKEIEYEEFVDTNIKLNKDLHRLSYEFYKELDKLGKIGCFLKDLELGLVDFYCKFEGRDIFLCWKTGEDKIKAWHEIDAGFADRKPVIDLVQR